MQSLYLYKDKLNFNKSSQFNCYNFLKSKWAINYWEIEHFFINLQAVYAPCNVVRIISTNNKNF